MGIQNRRSKHKTHYRNKSFGLTLCDIHRLANMTGNLEVHSTSFDYVLIAMCHLQHGWQYNLTLILLTRRIWRAPNNASKWLMGFNSAFKGLATWMAVTFNVRTARTPCVGIHQTQGEAIPDLDLQHGWQYHLTLILLTWRIW